MQEKTSTIRVWDPVVRAGHWLLVTGFFTAYLTGDDFLTLHVWAGYLVAAVVLFRILWGLIGTKHARFGDFIGSPRRIMGYLAGLLRGNAPRHTGHNPAGGAMIILLLFSLIFTSGSGLMVYAYEENAGPLKNRVHATGTSSTLPALIATAYADSNHENHAFEEAEEFWEESHEFFANFTLLLILLHVGGVLVSGMAHKENLVKAMITGRKRAE